MELSHHSFRGASLLQFADIFQQGFFLRWVLPLSCSFWLERSEGIHFQ